jgi:hypothetical protein
VTVVGTGGLITAAALSLTGTRNIVLITAAQIVACLLLMAITVHMSQLLHDAVPSTVRAGVASGVSTSTWLVFLPFSLVFGVVSDSVGVHSAALLLAGAAILITSLLAVTARRRPEPVAGSTAEPAAEPAPLAA